MAAVEHRCVYCTSGSSDGKQLSPVEEKVTYSQEELRIFLKKKN